VNPCREYERKASRPREFTRNLSAKEESTPSESLPRVRKKNLSAKRVERKLSVKEEFTQVNPCREYERKASQPLGLSAKRVERKPLDQGRIHPSEILPRVRKKNLSAKRVERKPLGQGRIHLSESPPRVRKKNLSAKRVRRKALGQGRIHPSESLPRVQKKSLSASRPREFERKPLGQRLHLAYVFHHTRHPTTEQSRTHSACEHSRQFDSTLRLYQLTRAWGAYVQLDGRKADQTTKPTRRQDAKLNT